MCEFQWREGVPFVIKFTYISPQRIWVRSSKTLGEAFEMCFTQIFGVQLNIEDEVL